MNTGGSRGIAVGLEFVRRCPHFLLNDALQRRANVFLLAKAVSHAARTYDYIFPPIGTYATVQKDPSFANS